ncbi:hypothetical protein [Phytomonospora endophytica]|uniref:Uncharacterized protein n=1 Tax=Phytomonospora endophytica TaxID=714109 RepID=A0A841FL10_9ACTN|nr:hypothetical protein [Phytomonospora endophytica]MBB6036544.1 hypothetical protein [Phytomonospora endophytica]GIG65866.1 hypothetical protein Pen01_21610 [Phytomonospora endophytica]
MAPEYSILPPVGAMVAAAVVDLGRRPGVSVKTKVTETTVQYDVSAPSYRMVIFVDPESWVGMVFTVLDDQGGELLSTSHDTDLYPIGLDLHRWFAREIEEEIVELVHDLLHGGVHVGEVGGRRALVVPLIDGIRRVVGTAKAATHRDFPDRSQAMAEGTGWRELT